MGIAVKGVFLVLIVVAALAACQDDEISISGICAARCAQTQECDDYTFNSEYGGSIETCRKLCREELDQYYDDYEPAECKDLSMELEQCRAELDCDDLNKWVVDEIDGELTLTGAHCRVEYTALRECEGEQ